MGKLSVVSRTRRWLNSLNWVVKVIAGILGGLVAIWFAVTPALLWSADRVNEANGYVKSSWVAQLVQTQNAPLQSAIQGQSSLVLRQWWNQNRWAIQSLEDTKGKRPLADWERRKLNDLHDERDQILQEYKKAGLTPPST